MDSRLHQAHLRSTNNIRSSPAIPFRNSPSPSPNLNPFTSKPQIPPLAPDQKHRRGPDFSRTTNLSTMQGERPSAQSSAARPVSSDLRSKTVQFSKGTLDVLAKASEILQKSSKITIGSSGGPPTASSIPIDRTQFERVTPTSVQTQNFSAKTSNALGKADEILKKSLGYTRDSRVSAGKGGESSSRPHETAKSVFENNTHHAMVERNDKLHHTHVPIVAKASSDDQEKKLHSIFSRIDQTLQRSLQITNNSMGPTPTNLSTGNSNLLQSKPVISHERPRQNHFETPPATQFIDRTLRTDYKEKKDHVSSYQENQKLIPEMLRNEHEKLSKTLPARKADNELAATTHMKSSLVMERRQNIESNSPFAERKTVFVDSENNKEIAPQQAVPLPIRIKKPKFVEEDYEDGTVYKGEKIRETKHGRGEILYPDGSRYEGEWENDIKNGYGVQTFPNGNVEYDGEWKDDNYHGNGVLMNENARENRGFSCQDFDTLENNWTKYEGEFLSGKMHGLGTLTLFNNERYVGKFKNDKVHGVGVFHMRNGDTVSAQWENNKLVRS